MKRLVSLLHPERLESTQLGMAQSFCLYPEHQEELRSDQEAPSVCSPNNILAAFHAYGELSQISLVLANS